MASSASRPSIRTASGVPAVNPSTLVDRTMSASPVGFAFSSSPLIGRPSHFWLLIRSPPTGFDTHASVT